MRDRLVYLMGEAVNKCKTRIVETGCRGCEEYVKGENCIDNIIADHLIENGVIVPPYKCGTVVYVLRSQTSNSKNMYMREERIDHYRTFNDGTFMIFESGRISVRNDQWSRSVFATQEEAEQALKGEQNNG